MDKGWRLEIREGRERQRERKRSETIQTHTKQVLQVSDSPQSSTLLVHQCTDSAQAGLGRLKAHKQPVQLGSSCSLFTTTNYTN